MSQRIFEPIVSVYLPGDPRIHGKALNPEDQIHYKISYGIENGNHQNQSQSSPYPCFKVQMCKGHKVKGRQAPSYTDEDFAKIVEIKKVLSVELKDLDLDVRDVEYEYDAAHKKLIRKFRR